VTVIARTVELAAAATGNVDSTPATMVWRRRIAHKYPTARVVPEAMVMSAMVANAEAWGAISATSDVNAAPPAVIWALAVSDANPALIAVRPAMIPRAASIAGGGKGYACDQSEGDAQTARMGHDSLHLVWPPICG
jgi:hypothetical protein